MKRLHNKAFIMKQHLQIAFHLPSWTYLGKCEQIVYQVDHPTEHTSIIYLMLNRFISLQTDVSHTCTVFPRNGSSLLLLSACWHCPCRWVRVYVCEQYVANKRNGKRDARLTLHTVLPSGWSRSYRALLDEKWRRLQEGSSHKSSRWPIQRWRG